MRFKFEGCMFAKFSKTDAFAFAIYSYKIEN